MKKTLLWVVCFSFAGSASAQDAGSDICAGEHARLVSDQEMYQRDFQGFKEKGDQMKEDSVAMNVDVGWSDQRIVFNVPSVTIKDQRIIFGVPQTTVVNKHMSFDVPSVTMKDTKTGQYPETTCHDTWIHVGPIKTKGVPSCTVTWHDIITKIPVSTMQRTDIVLGVPEFTWKDTTVVAGIPQLTNQEVTWIIGLPQFTVRSIAINSKKIESESESLQNAMAEKKEAMTKDVGGDIHSVFACYRTDVSSKRLQAETQFNSGLSQLDSSIQNVRASGADPANLKSSDGHSLNLIAQRADLARKRDDAMASFDSALSQLDQSEKTAVASIVN